MHRIYLSLIFILSTISYASPNPAALSVWVNEAIIATYTYDYQNFIEEQKQIAKYFTASGWTNYSAALKNAGLINSVQKNNYIVNAVATWPPKIMALSETRWQAVMPILVVYKNPQYQQKQTLEVTIIFSSMPSNQGVRGLAIESLQTKVKDPICQCMIKPITPAVKPPETPTLTNSEQ